MLWTSPEAAVVMGGYDVVEPFAEAFEPGGGHFGFVDCGLLQQRMLSRGSALCVERGRMRLVSI